MGKKFVGLDGLKHFWKQAKIWIAGRITGEVTARIAEVVANAPEDLDTLKEIADWISAHADSASEMNTQINTNKNDIAALQTSLAGKADTEHTHTKSEITDFPTSLKNPNALTVNGKTYDGSSAVDAGVQTVANGGTGVTTQAEINRAFIGNLEVGGADVTDGTEFVSSYASNNGFTDPGGLNKPYKRKFSAVWNYIKNKISSLFGVTADSNENAWSGKQNFNAGINVVGDIQLNSKTLYPSRYVPRTYFIESARRDTITAEQKELLRKMFAYQSVNRLIQCYGTLVYKINSADKVLSGRVVTVGYFDGDDWLDSNDNISYDDNSSVNYACFGVQEDSEDINFIDMYNLSERVMRNRFDSLNYLLVSRLCFTVLEKI